jgi:hypothetical protein
MKKTEIALAIILISALLSSCMIPPQPTSTPTEIIEPVVDCPFGSTVPTAQIPSSLYGKTGLANAELSYENFSFVFWLYCDPTLQPNSDGENYSAIPSLGLLATWRYTGNKVEGHNADFWGFGNDIKSNTSWDGPLYRASSGFGGGIYLPEEVVTNMIEAQSAFQFSIGVDSPLGKNGVAFSFTVKKDGDTYIISDITAKRVES